jgi:hypothetical protein
MKAPLKSKHYALVILLFQSCRPTLCIKSSHSSPGLNFIFLQSNIRKAIVVFWGCAYSYIHVLPDGFQTTDFERNLPGKTQIYEYTSPSYVPENNITIRIQHKKFFYHYSSLKTQITSPNNMAERHSLPQYVTF